MKGAMRPAGGMMIERDGDTGGFHHGSRGALADAG